MIATEIKLRGSAAKEFHKMMTSVDIDSLHARDKFISSSNYDVDENGILSIDISDLDIDSSVLTCLIEPTPLVKYLMDKGWKIFPRKRQDIKVLQVRKADGSFFQVTIPLSRALSDYNEALSIALETVAEAENMDKRQLIAKLISPTINNSAIE